jgi:hypothetical protein
MQRDRLAAKTTGGCRNRSAHKMNAALAWSRGAYFFGRNPGGSEGLGGSAGGGGSCWGAGRGGVRVSEAGGRTGLPTTFT